MNYVFPCIITDIFERLLRKHTAGSGAEAVFSTASAGWYIQLDEMRTIFVGAEKPEWKTGDKLQMILRKP